MQCCAFFGLRYCSARSLTGLLATSTTIDRQTEHIRMRSASYEVETCSEKHLSHWGIPQCSPAEKAWERWGALMNHREFPGVARALLGKFALESTN